MQQPYPVIFYDFTNLEPELKLNFDRVSRKHKSVVSSFNPVRSKNSSVGKNRQDRS